MTKVLLTREHNHPLLNGTLPFVAMVAGIYMAITTPTRPLLSVLFIAFAVFSFVSGILFWRTRNLLTRKGENLIFQGFFSRLLLPAKQVTGIQTEGHLLGRYKLSVQTADAVYTLSIPEPNGREWAELRRHLDNKEPFPYHLN